MNDPRLIERAAFMLLATKSQAAVMADEEADTFLKAEGLVAPIEGIDALTERGMAWWSMLVQTPLPVQVAKWGDPRKLVGVSEGEGEPWGLRRADGATLIVAAPKAPDGLAPALALPPGFHPNQWPDKDPPFLPPGAERDDELEVVWRDGQRRSMFAGSVVWKHSDPPRHTDTMGYRKKG